MIKVMVVDDSALMRSMITEILNSAPNINVVGVAKNGMDALEKLEKYKPDVITMDVEMPRMDGLTALRYIMAKNPLPVVMLTAMDKVQANLVMKSLNFGAVDFIPKPSKTVSLDIVEVKKILISKVLAASTINVKKIKINNGEAKFIKKLFLPPKTEKRILVIGASTGGPQALSKIISNLQRNFPLTVLVVQHMLPGFTQSLVESLSWQSSIAIKEAENDDVLLPGMVFVAPSDYHMIIKNGRIKLHQEPKVNGLRPSIDVTMKVVAKLYGDKVIGVLLSGMGKDGAIGMKNIKEKNGITIVQDEITSFIFGMPNEAIKMGVVDYIKPLSQIVEKITEVL